MGSEKIPITENTVFEVGDVIWCDMFEWEVQEFLPNGRFLTHHRPAGTDGPFQSSTLTWTGNEFMHDRYFLIKKEKPLLAYNPNQAGDTDDDI